MALTDTIRDFFFPPVRQEARSGEYPLTLDQWASMMSYNGNQYTINQTLVGNPQSVPANFEGVIRQAYKDNGVVFACELARTSLFSEARFQFRQRQKGRPGDLFGSTDLAILETPWPGGTTGDLLTLMLLYADFGGSAFVTRRKGQLRVLRPDWITVVHGTNDDVENGYKDLDELNAELVGYLYHPGGRYAGNKPTALLPSEVARFTPSVDPLNPYRGIPWVSTAIREVLGDKAATDHKLAFFENGATPNLVVKLDIADLTKFNEWVNQMELNHKGSANAYRTLYMGSGADATVVGTDLKQLDFKAVQGAGETRIAAAAGVPPIIAGFSEGLDSATYSNYGQARRRFADLTIRPLWRNVAGSLSQIIQIPAGAELWYDDRDIPFLAEDVKDAVESQGIQSRTIRTLTDAGFTADSVIEAVNAQDWNRLVHSGLFSVQLQPPGTTTPDAPAEPPIPDAARMLADFAREQRQAPPTVTFNEGAFHIETPVTVHPAEVRIEDGAIRSETPVSVTTPDVRFEQGAIRVDSPITVEPTTVTIEDGAIRSETPVTVHTPDVTIEKGAVQVDSPVTVEPVTVEPAQVTIEQPARRTVRKDVTHDAKGRITRVVETEE